MPENNDASNSAEIPSSIPEIYFDIIARVIPGVIAIGIYKPAALSNALSTPALALILLCSYFLGLLLHVVGDSIWWIIFYKWQPRMAKHISWLKVDTIAELWEWIRNLPLVHRAVFTKMMAERSMFQATALIALASVFFPPRAVSKNYDGPAWLITIPAFCALLFGMLVVHRWVSWNKEVLMKKDFRPSLSSGVPGSIAVSNAESAAESSPPPPRQSSSGSSSE